MTQKVIRTVAQYMVNKLDGNIPSRNVKINTANSLKAVFPRVFEKIMDILLPGNTGRGKLGTAFKNAKVAFEKQNFVNDDSDDEELEDGESGNEEMNEAEPMEESDIESDEEDESEEASGEEMMDQPNDSIEWTPDLIFLRDVVVSSRNIREIKQSLMATSQYRRNEIMNGNTQLFFNLYRQDARFVLYDFELYWPEKSRALLDNKDKLNQFVNDLEKKSQKAIRDKFDVINSEITTFQMLIILLGKTVGGAKNAANCVVRSIPESATPTTLLELCQNITFPMIFKRGDQFIINIDGQPINLPPAKFSNFFCAFDLLFKIYYVFHLQYPPMLTKFYQFFATGIYGLVPLRGESYLLREIHGKWINYQSNESEEDSDGDSTQNSQDD